MSIKQLYIVIGIYLLFSGCVASERIRTNQTRIIRLNFNNCYEEGKSYNSISIRIPKNFKLKKAINHGYCEYRLKYKGNIHFYVSSDIYKGSSLNYGNLYRSGITSYAKNRSDNFKDTIKNNGQDDHSLYWLEYILGDVVIGYFNVPMERKAEFDNAINSLVRE